MLENPAVPLAATSYALFLISFVLFLWLKAHF